MRAKDWRTASGIWSGGTSAALGGPRPSMFTIQRTDSGQVAATPPAWPPPKRVGDEARPAPHRGGGSAERRRGGSASRRSRCRAARCRRARGSRWPRRGSRARRCAARCRRTSGRGRRRRAGTARADRRAEPHPHVRNVVRPTSTSSARSGSGIPTAGSWPRRCARRSRVRGTDRWRRARSSGRPWACPRRPSARWCGRRRCARPSCPRSSPSRPGWSCWAGPRAPCTPGGSTR